MMLHGHDLPSMVHPQSFGGTNELQKHFSDLKVPAHLSVHQASDGGRWVMCAANPYSGVLAADVYLYRALPGTDQLVFASLLMIKGASRRDCRLETVEKGVWITVLGDRRAYLQQ